MTSLLTLMEDYGLVVSPESAGGFTLGFFVGAICILLLVILLVLHRHNKIRRDSVTVNSENGTLFITSNAVREFVGRILGQYEAASLHGIALRQRSDSLNLRIDMDVLPDTQVVPMVDDIRAAIIGQAAEKLGITMPIRVDVSLRSLSAKEGKIDRQHRRSGVSVKGSKPSKDESNSVSAPDASDMREHSLDLSEDEETAERTRQAWEVAAMEAEQEGVVGDEFAQTVEPPIVKPNEEPGEQSQQETEEQERDTDKKQGKDAASDKTDE
ncbi:MAG: hypothetical protein ACOCUY_00115 [Verrucomicrobiota bacterium]